ncbi:MAG: DNA polymerase III subunit chi [Lautropia sp.]|nr:DNA polymerase III subunit chi [Lautropia sp.]
MTQVDFHINVPDVSQYGCRLVRKAWQAGHRVIIYCEDTQRLAGFDQLLWTFAPLSFIPHVSVRHPLAARTPVLLTASDADVPASHRQVLVNLGDSMPPAFTGYHRVVELVGRDAPSLQAARIRFRAYRDQGYTPRTHDVEERDGNR